MPQLPRRFEAHMQEKLGNEFPAFRDALEEKPPVSIRLHPEKGADLYPDAAVIPWCSYGRYLDKRPAFVWDPLYHAGAYYAQEASSMLFANAIDFSQDLKVLDLCAAPGGKSSLLLSFLSKESLLISNEMVGKRCSILYENLVKWGAANNIVTNNRASDFGIFRHYFDVVVVDAPCSGEGMFRKDRGAIEQWSEGLVTQCSMVQKDILNTAVELIADGGLLVYSTCTFEEQENEDMLAWLYDTYGDMLEPATIPVHADWGITEIEVKTSTGQLQKGYYCFQHKVKGEGQFISVMRVNSGKTQQLKGIKPLQKLGKSEISLLQNYQRTDIELKQAIWGEKLINFPPVIEEAIALATHRLRVRKAGTASGIVSRGNFIPEHEAVMDGLVSEQVTRVPLNIQQALDYMQRKTVLAPEGTSKGWIVFTYEAQDIGWAKNLGNRVNNHYPSDWRIRKEPDYDEL